MGIIIRIVVRFGVIIQRITCSMTAGVVISAHVMDKIYIGNIVIDAEENKLTEIATEMH